MNIGTISSRYAKALLKSVTQSRNGDAVYQQVCQILKNPDMARTALEPDLQAFLSLVIENGRIEFIKFILSSFCSMYEHSLNIKRVQFTTAVSAPDIETRIKQLLEKKTGSVIIMEAKVDPSIIGGFIIELDDKLLDASVKGQIDNIKRQFAESKSRIV